MKAVAAPSGGNSRFTARLLAWLARMEDRLAGSLRNNGAAILDFYSLRVRMVAAVLVATGPALILLYVKHYLPFTAAALAVLAGVTAWYGAELFVVYPLRVMLATVHRLRNGDLTARTGLETDRGEVAQLARAIDEMAAAAEQRTKEREIAEQRLLNRALQQSVVAALGQFALVTNDLMAMLNQAIGFVFETVDCEFCQVLELQPDGKTLLMRSGAGWRDGTVGTATVSSDPTTLAGYTLTSGEPVMIADLRGDGRFTGAPYLEAHGAASAASVAIASPERTYGVLAVYSNRVREFSGEDVQFLLAVANAIASAVDRQCAEAKLQQLAAFVRLNPNPAMELASDGTISYANEGTMKAAARIEVRDLHDLLPPNYIDTLRACLENGQTLAQEGVICGRTFAWTFHPVYESQTVHCYGEDISDRLSLEAQLRQSQKIESVGHLAAGVAHDFNNMLTIIHGHVGILMARQNLPQEHMAPLQAVFFAAERAAGLTRQLLMFSRKNIMQSSPLDLREVVGNMTKMLKRLIGETIVIDFTPPPTIPLIYGDMGMIEQVVMNLAINARDAMPHGGKLILDVHPALITDPAQRRHPEARVGEFVCLSVADTGTGMDDDIKTRIFEPFFTTKEPGKGTGLGLATVHGIVKQHDGWIEVASTVGQGTMFTLFLPSTGEIAAEMRPPQIPGNDVRGGTETILVVEDEPLLLNLARVILEDCGYRVISAASGIEALDIWVQRGDEINMVVTDVVMPEGVSGLDLARRLVPERPGLKVVYTSGYGVNAMDTEFIRTSGGSFLQKPYSRYTLAKAVRECLDEPASADAEANPENQGARPSPPEDNRAQGALSPLPISAGSCD